MFFNTGITTYIWILTNKKIKQRKGKVQLIDGSSFGTSMRKNLGDKSKYFRDEEIQSLNKLYLDFKENENCKIYDNDFFGYTKVIVEQPLLKDGKVQKDKKGKSKTDPKKRDFEKIPLKESIEDYTI